MSGLRDIFFKPKQEPNMFVSQFINLDDLVQRQLQKEGLTMQDVNQLSYLASIMKREDIVERLIEVQLKLTKLSTSDEPSEEKSLKLGRLSTIPSKDEYDQ